MLLPSLDLGPRSGQLQLQWILYCDFASLL